MEKPESKWEGLSKDSDSLLSKKLAEGLVLSDTEHDLAMQIHKYSSQEPTANPEGVNYTEMNPPALSPTHGNQTPGLCLPFLPTSPQQFMFFHVCPAFFPAWVPSNPKIHPPPSHHSLRR